MSQMVELNFRPDVRTLRQFGYIAAVGFGLLALAAWNDWLIFSFGLGEWRQVVVRSFVAIGAISLLFSLVFPKANWPIFVGLSIVALPIGFVLSYVLMAVLFYVIIAPIGLLLRVFGTDPMDRHLRPEAETYWVDASAPKPRESYFKQF